MEIGINELIKAYSRIEHISHYHNTRNTTLIALRYLMVLCNISRFLVYKEDTDSILVAEGRQDLIEEI